jgi:outer membrane protein assembly factor BamB
MIVSKPLLANGNVYFGALNKLIALDAATGAVKWEKTFDTNEWVWSDPTLQNNIIYLGTLAGKVYAFDALTGEAKWAQPFVAGGQIRSAIVIDGNVGYFGSTDQKAYALQLDTAQLKWNPVPLGGPILASPTVENGTLYIPTTGYNGVNGYNMYALNAADGVFKWCYDTSTNAACAQQAAQ